MFKLGVLSVEFRKTAQAGFHATCAAPQRDIPEWCSSLVPELLYGGSTRLSILAAKTL